MQIRSWIGTAAAFGLALVASAPREAAAGGWTEIHQTSDDVRVAVGPDGVATVTHHLRYRIIAGRFKTFDFAGVPPQAELTGEATILAEKNGDELAARVEANPREPGTAKISFDEPKGLKRGGYLVDVKYRIDLVAAKLLTRDGAMWKLAWVAPVSPEGHDGARVVFELPPAPTEPRLASPEQAATTLATLRRDNEKDELELVRAHVPRGEAATWAARVDPKAFPRVTAPELRPPVAAVAPPPPPNHVPVVLVASGLAVLAGALAFLLRAKQRFVALGCEARGMSPRPLVNVRFGLGPFAYGAAGAGALALLLWGPPIWGAAFAVTAVALAAHRTPTNLAKPRGPGRWQPVADQDVLVRRSRVPAPGDLLDVGTKRGLLVFVLGALATAGLAFVLRNRVPGATVAIPLAAAVLVPIFLTGTRGQRPGEPADLAARILGPARDTLGRLVDLGHVDVRCLARFREGTESFDEVRLACAPSEPIPGLRTIELAALASSAAVALPEVLVRFDDGSAAAAKIAQMAPGVRIVPGRAPEEKVLRLAPRIPTPAGAARLLARLASDLEGRRATDRPGSGGDGTGDEGKAGGKTRRPRARGFVGVDRRVPLRMDSPVTVPA